jgi:hypothetical protein
MALFRPSNKNENGKKMILIRSKHHLDFRMNETPNPNVYSEIFAMQGHAIISMRMRCIPRHFLAS